MQFNEQELETILRRLLGGTASGGLRWQAVHGRASAQRFYTEHGLTRFTVGSKDGDDVHPFVLAMEDLSKEYDTPILVHTDSIVGEWLVDLVSKLYFKAKDNALGLTARAERMLSELADLPSFDD